MIFGKSNRFLKKLELISENKDDRILRLKGYITNQDKKNEYLEIIIFKGFSSSITHPTEFDLSRSLLPDNAIIEKGELLYAPMDPKNEIILMGPVKATLFLKEKNWLV